MYIPAWNHNNAASIAKIFPPPSSFPVFNSKYPRISLHSIVERFYSGNISESHLPVVAKQNFFFFVLNFFMMYVLNFFMMNVLNLWWKLTHIETDSCFMLNWMEYEWIKIVLSFWNKQDFLLVSERKRKKSLQSYSIKFVKKPWFIFLIVHIE